MKSNISFIYLAASIFLKKIFLRISGLPNVLYKYGELANMNIIVHSPGKVGSSSVYHSFIKAFPLNTNILHNHYLSDIWLKEILPKTNFFKRDINLGNKTRRKLAKSNKKNYYIVLVRDPVARDLSNVIQNYNYLELDINNNNAKNMIKEINEKGHDFISNWFETEFMDYFGCEIYQCSFSKTLGYGIHSLDENNKVLIMKCENLESNFKKAIQDFLGFDIELIRTNETSSKLEANFYNDLKNVYYIDNNLAYKTYSNKVIEYFYSDDEIAKFKRRWCK